jgi:hypothetical protein
VNNALRLLAPPAILLLGLAVPARAMEATPAEIMATPGRFAGQIVTVRGTLTNLQLALPGGGPAALFDVMERGGFVKVLSPTPPPCPVGSPVTVQGRFDLARRVGRQTIPNVLEAFLVTCR